MPIHVRANEGDYAEACLLPGDPLRARYVAETFLENVEQKNWERGMLGYTGTWEGRPVSVQATGMGCPSAAIVVEELAQLGVRRMIRIGTCGGLQPDMKLGDLIVALSAVPADSSKIFAKKKRSLSGVPVECTPWSALTPGVSNLKNRGAKIAIDAMTTSAATNRPKTISIRLFLI